MHLTLHDSVHTHHMAQDEPLDVSACARHIISMPSMVSGWLFVASLLLALFLSVCLSYTLLFSSHFYLYSDLNLFLHVDNAKANIPCVSANWGVLLIGRIHFSHMMRVPMRSCVCSDKFARLLTCVFWVGGVRWRPCFDKLVTGDAYVVTGWSRVTPILWVGGVRCCLCYRWLVTTHVISSWDGRRLWYKFLKNVVQNGQKDTNQYRKIQKTYRSILKTSLHPFS